MRKKSSKKETKRKNPVKSFNPDAFFIMKNSHSLPVAQFLGFTNFFF
jgi:hypothetical protein